MDSMRAAKLGASGAAGVVTGATLAKRLVDHFNPITFIFSSYLGRNTIFNGTNDIIYGTGVKFFKGVNWVNPFLTIVLPCVIVLFIPILLIIVPYVKKDSSWIWIPECLKYLYYNDCDEEVDQNDPYYGCKIEESELAENDICYQICADDSVNNRSGCPTGTSCLSTNSDPNADTCDYPYTCQASTKTAVKKCVEESETEKNISILWWVLHIIVGIISIVITVYLFRFCKYAWYMRMNRINSDIPDFKAFINAFAFGDLLGLY